ncbi:MAG: gliding motility-associated C-terminal domain-containing protein [Bacteroidales bacterium]|nr:gliding motility-associated C-terminal domain-containing protein [Bacteroidales bacterium]
MKTALYLFVIFIVISAGAKSQYLYNPSFEGQILMIGPPPDWDICIENSSPNVQPGKYNVFLPPSDGITYIGLYTRDDFTWEDITTTLQIPLAHDSCYTLKIDLAFQDFLSFTFVDPVVLKFYGGNSVCDKSVLLWQSPPISNNNWLTYEFDIHNDEFDITDLSIDAYYVGTFPYAGYVLCDNIRIERYPEFNLGNDTTVTICSNDSILLDPGPGYVEFLWQDGSTGPVYYADTTGLYWVQAFNSEGCSWTDSIYITVEEYIEMIPEMIDSTYVCEGQQISFEVSVTNGAGPYSYQWQGFPDTTATLSVVADSTTFYYVTITDKCGSSITDSVKLVVAPDPEIDLGEDTLVCIDGSYELNAGGGYWKYQWQDGNEDSIYLVTEPGLYWVQVTSFFGCTAADSIYIDVFPPINLNIGNDTILCLGEELTINAPTGFISYLWQDNSTNNSLTVDSTGIFWVEVTDNNGCHAVDSILVEFLSLPEIDLGSDFNICEGDDQTITPGEGFESYLWQDGSTGEAFVVTGAGIYWVTVDNGCGIDTDSIQVYVDPSPQVDFGADTAICEGESITLNPGFGFVSYLWQDNTNNPFYTVVNTGSYSVTVENIYGCFGEDEIYIDISDPQVDLGADRNICEGDTLILEAGEGFIQYQWQDNSANQQYAVDSPGAYFVWVQDQVGCTATDTVNISYYPYPNVNPTENAVICEGETTILEAPEGEYTYYWNGIPGSSTLEIATPGQYLLSVVNPCDSVSGVINVDVNPIPYVNLGIDQILLPGETLELDAGSGYDEYVWQDGSGSQYFLVSEANVSADNPFYFVEVTAGGCKNSDTIRIELFKIWVPALITPNNDGKNDCFCADPDRWSGINDHVMSVFNRWGEKIWESQDFLTGWDGKRNGRLVSDGTYYWILEVDYGDQHLSQTMKGTLTLLGGDN